MQTIDFGRLLETAQTLVARVRVVASAEERGDLLDELDMVLNELGHERVGLQEHVDELVRAAQGLEERCR
jgi:hypothetical protein